MRALTKRLSVAIACTIIGDLCLFDRPLGLGLTVFSLLVGAVALRTFGAGLLAARGWGILWLALAFSGAVEPSGTAALLLVALGWAILALGRMEAPRSLFRGLVRGISAGFRSYGAAPSDLRRAVYIGRWRAGRASMPLWVYVVPIAITLVFAMLLLPANVVLSRIASRGVERLLKLCLELDLQRIGFWFLVGAGVYGITRFRLGRPLPCPMPPAMPLPEERHRQELRACLATFLCVNALFLVANATDIVYLWGRGTLPEGITFSAYTHRGAYRLVFAVILAAFTIELFLRRGTRQAEHPLARALAYLFVAQNLLVLAGAAQRLSLYADAYGLTRLRAATALWLALVAIGLVLVAIRIRRGHTLLFLLEANTRSAILALSLWAVLDVDGFVARFNVERHLRDRETLMDVGYLEGLGPAALPSLERLAREGAGAVAARARQGADQALARARHENRHWASWSLRRWLAIREAERLRPGS